MITNTQRRQEFLLHLLSLQKSAHRQAVTLGKALIDVGTSLAILLENDVYVTEIEAQIGRTETNLQDLEGSNGA